MPGPKMMQKKVRDFLKFNISTIMRDINSAPTLEFFPNFCDYFHIKIILTAIL